MLAGEGLADPAAFLILRALSGSNGKVEIGGRRFAFSCIPTFRLEDIESGQVHECRGSGSLLEQILLLLRDVDAIDVSAAGGC